MAVGSYGMCLSLLGRDERSTMLKAHEEELRQLDDEIAACKWTQTHRTLLAHV